MRLTDKQAAKFAISVGRNIQYSGEELVRMLRRYPTESESEELYELIKSAVELVLIDFEFADPEAVPNIDPIQAWADDHKGVGFRRPKGHVVYTVTGEIERVSHGWSQYPFIVVQRSSDGKSQSMSIKELKAMVKEGA